MSILHSFTAILHILRAFMKTIGCCRGVDRQYTLKFEGSMILIASNIIILQLKLVSLACMQYAAAN